MEPVISGNVGKTNIQHFDGFDLTTGTIGGLVGELSVYLDVAINAGEKPVTIESADLITSDRIYAAKVYDRSHVDIVSPNVPREFLEERHFTLGWELYDSKSNAPFKGAAYVLSKKAQIVLHLRIGEKETVTEIDYKRVR
jgi:hypothetical protein